MVHHVVLFKLKPDLSPDVLEEMMRETRIRLLKIPEAMNVKCGKRIDPENEWPFFIAVDFESMDRLAAYRDDPVHMKFVADILTKYTSARLALDYEMEPVKDVRFS